MVSFPITNAIDVVAMSLAEISRRSTAKKPLVLALQPRLCDLTVNNYVAASFADKPVVLCVREAEGTEKQRLVFLTRRLSDNVRSVFGGVQGKPKLTADSSLTDIAAAWRNDIFAPCGSELTPKTVRVHESCCLLFIQMETTADLTSWGPVVSGKLLRGSIPDRQIGAVALTGSDCE